MSCSCHNGAQIAGAVKPDDQCTTCAAKHLEMALAAWGEFAYEESNRRWVAGHIRLAVEHMKLAHRETALRLRDLAVAIEDVRDLTRDEMRLRLEEVMRDVLALQHADRPDVATRLDALRISQHAVDIVIPLGAGSKSDNDELRILLRSVEQHLRGYGDIYLVTTCAPEWVRGVTIVPIDDTYDSNKDANLHRKTLETLERYDIGDFIWTADDAVIMQDVEASAIPILYNPKTKESYMQDGAAGKWRRRVQNTFRFLDSKGINLYWNYEVHCPQLFDGRFLREKMRGVDYASGAGLTIYNTWRGLTDSWRRAAPQTLYKATYEIALYDDYKTDDLGSKMFVGYNDATFLNGLRDRLFEIYKEKSSYEQ